MKDNRYEGATPVGREQSELDVIVHNYKVLLDDYAIKIARFKEIGLKLKNTFCITDMPDNDEFKGNPDFISALQHNNTEFGRKNVELNDLLDSLDQII